MGTHVMIGRAGESLLLYLETRAVDYGGIVDGRHMNNEDFALARKWNDAGYIEFGRRCAEDSFRPGSQGGYYVRLTDRAWKRVRKARKDRADRGWERRRWKTAEENNNE